MNPVARLIHGLLARQPRGPGRPPNIERLVGTATAIHGLHQNRTVPFKLSRPQLLAKIQSRVSDLDDSALRRITDKLVEIGFLFRVPQPGVGQNVPGLSHYYYWTPESQAALQLVSPNLALSTPAALIALAERDGNFDGSGPLCSANCDGNFDHHKDNNILSGGENMVAQIRTRRNSTPSSVVAFSGYSTGISTTGVRKDHLPVEIRSAVGRNSQCSNPSKFVWVPDGPVRRFEGRLRKFKPGEDRPTAGEEKPSDWLLPPVEYIETQEEVVGVAVVARTVDGLPLTGTQEGLMKLLEAKSQPARDAVREPRPYDPGDPLDPQNIFRRCGLGVIQPGETAEEKAVRLKAEDDARAAAIEAEIAKRTRQAFESQVEHGVLLNTDHEYRRIYIERQIERAVEKRMADKTLPSKRTEPAIQAVNENVAKTG